MVVVAVFVQPFTSVPVTVYVLLLAGVNATLLVTPPLHEYVDAPVPLSVTAVPLHTVVAGAAVELTVGNGFTVTVMVAVFVQPVNPVPVTVYVVVASGTNATPFVTPPVHVYAMPPMPLSVTEFPAHTGPAGDCTALMFGAGSTVIVMVDVPVQPFPSVPVTVYVVVVLAANGTPSVTPPVHAYEEPPNPLSVTIVPSQTVDDGEAALVMFGAGFTVMVLVAVFVQPLASVPVTVYVVVALAANGTPSVTPPLHV